MKYEKPEIRALGISLTLIQNPIQKGDGAVDSIHHQLYTSASAYTADE